MCHLSDCHVHCVYVCTTEFINWITVTINLSLLTYLYPFQDWLSPRLDNTERKKLREKRKVSQIKFFRICLKESFYREQMSLTHGVSIFFDYCTAPATQRKVEGDERDIQLINMNEASSCLAWGYWVPHSPRKESSAYQGLPPPTYSPWQDYSSFQRPRPKSRTASI